MKNSNQYDSTHVHSFLFIILFEYFYAFADLSLLLSPVSLLTYLFRFSSAQ